MTAWLNRLEAAYLNQQLPGRLGLLLVAALCLVLLLDVAWLRSAGQQLGQLTETARITEARAADLAEALEALDREVADDPDAGVRELVESRRGEIALIDEALREQAMELLDAGEMKQVLREIIAGVTRLRLVSLHSLPVEALLLAESDGVPTLFRHGLNLELEGDYLALLEALKLLEAAPWRLYWSAVEVAVQEDGRRRFRLQLHTLSLREEWLRV